MFTVGFHCELINTIYIINKRHNDKERISKIVDCKKHGFLKS